MEITYANIKSLIRKETVVGGNQIQLEFQANNQAAPLATVAVIIPDQKEIKKNVAKQAVKGAVKSTLINQLFNLIGIRGIGRSVARTVTDNSFNKQTSSMMKTEITQEKKEKTIVEAFKPFATMYKFNDQTSEWEYTVAQ